MHAAGADPEEGGGGGGGGGAIRVKAPPPFEKIILCLWEMLVNIHSPEVRCVFPRESLGVPPLGKAHQTPQF